MLKVKAVPILSREKLGLCVRCGKMPFAVSESKRHIHCQNCLDDGKERVKRRRNKRAQNGLCISCGKVPSLVEGVNCRNCLDYRKIATKKLKQKRRQSNLCTICGAFLAFNSVGYCAYHYIYACRQSSKKLDIPFNMNIEEVSKAWTGCCFFCSSTTKRLQIDHDHVTGDFRNWVCSGCNTKLGAWEHMPPKMKEMLLSEVACA